MDKQLQLDEIEIKLYKKRWFVLALLVCLIFQMIFIYMNFGFLNNVLVLYFNTTYATIDWLYLGWNIGTTVAALVTSWFAAKGILTSRRSMIIAGSLQAVNSFFIVIGFLQPEWFFLLILGQITGGISAAILWSVPTSLAQLWFPESQIGIATGIALLGSSSAALVAYLLPAHVMKFPTNITSANSNITTSRPKSWIEYDKNAYQWLFFTLLTVSLVILVFLLTTVPERPENPPSFAQYLKRVKENEREKVTFNLFVSEIKKLICDYIFVACGIASSIMYFLPVVFSLSIESLVAYMLVYDSVFLTPETTSAYVLSLFSLGCWLGNISGGFIVDKFKNYHLQSSLGATFSFLFSVAVLLSVYFKSFIALLLVIFLVGVCTRIAYLSLLDSLMQHTYPIDPVFVMPFLIFIQNITIFLFVEVNRQIIYHVGLFGGLSSICVVLFFVALICLVFKPKTMRLSAEKSNPFSEHN